MTEPELVVEVDRVGHLGVCVGRADDGRAVLVRHALPGELVRVAVTETRPSYLRADAVEVLRASPHRVDRRCPWSGPGRCGGCDWQHVALAEQHRLKAEVVASQLRHLGGMDGPLLDDLVVEPVPGDDGGLGWRTRIRLAVDRNGVAGLRRHRSRTIERIGDCRISHPVLAVDSLVAPRWPPRAEVEAAVTVGPDGRPERVVGDAATRHRAAGRSWQVPAGGFWQVHPGAAETFVSAVTELLDPRPGERLVDLYGGVGLFAGALCAASGLAGAVVVEADMAAAVAARANLADLPVDVVTADVPSWLAGGGLDRSAAQLVVLDPPRRGAGGPVVDAICAAGPCAVAYVACDPSALGRDVGHFRERGWSVRRLRAFDAFPMTAHVETIALLSRDAA